MHPSIYARTTPDKPAIIMGASGEFLTYKELDEASNRGAHLFRELDCKTGDVVAILLENSLSFLKVAWAAQRSGLYFVGISTRLTPPEVAYILADSGARVLVTSRNVKAANEDLYRLVPDVACFMVGAPIAQYHSWDDAVIDKPTKPISDERAGRDLLYSSGTTGRPKGVLQPLPEAPEVDAISPLVIRSRTVFGMGEDTVYLCPAPIYHAAPLRFTMSIQQVGGTAVVMENFDAAYALELIERYKVTSSQWVPTHFNRILKLPPEERLRYDLSSQKLAIHAAAPCPVPVKQEMIEWWGPILHEYYGGSESIGMTSITSQEWLDHPGSVGRAKIGTVHICNDDGDPLLTGETGLVYFSGGPKFSYLNDPEKTAEAFNKHGWGTLGDIGRLDEEGYLYLTDRQSFMIISGGVNIYPQEIENLLVTHPRVADVAVFGAPDAEMGERVVAVVQPMDWAEVGEPFADELRKWTRERLSGVKTPRQFDFLEELPRHATGKLYKRLLRDQYWGKSDSKIV